MFVPGGVGHVPHRMDAYGNAFAGSAPSCRSRAHKAKERSGRLRKTKPSGWAKSLHPRASDGLARSGQALAATRLHLDRHRRLVALELQHEDVGVDHKLLRLEPARDRDRRLLAGRERQWRTRVDVLLGLLVLLRE